MGETPLSTAVQAAHSSPAGTAVDEAGMSSRLPAAHTDRYTRTEGRAHITGLQALVRISLDQLRRDRAEGRRTGALYSGYPGSPLAGLDQTLIALEPLLSRKGVHFSPAINEELAAGAVCGSQLIDLFPHSAYDGVLGLWFGKAPGLDRALDVMRHANFMGVSRFGGALAIVGDDPFCKSSSLPSHSEFALAHAMVPTLQPADASDVLALGRHAFALSRYAGLWVALKVVADVADGGAIVDLDAREAPVQLPKFDVLGHSFERKLDPRLLPPHVNRIEQHLIYERLEAARRYAAANGLNPITVRGDADRVGLVASGRLYRELETALDLLDLDRDACERSGVRVLKLEMIYPLDESGLREFADGLDEIIVVDERRGFIEDQLRAALFNCVDRPHMIGQRDPEGAPWLARHAEITAETLALDLAPRLAHHLARPDDRSRLEAAARRIQSSRERAQTARAPARAPHFCSGCPHSASTRLPEGSVAGGGIGCHTMALLMDRHIEFIGAMGAEGSQWIGLAPFVDTPHLFQNLGDGTYCHSGRQAVRACVEAGVSITFKLLYNGAIAMTGGQDAVGMKPPVDIARDLLADGVARVVAVSEDADLRAAAAVDSRLGVVAREQFDAAMLELRDEPGVTVLLYDRVCANQKARLQRRGVIAAPEQQILINRDVCEGCGDCRARSTCASLHVVETALGPKTEIHASSCTDDRVCLEGDCPAFVGLASEIAVEPWTPPALPEPGRAPLGSRFGIYMVGIGSTGIVTLDALLVRAAELEGLHARHLDQTGLAQRGGKVSSHCVISAEPLAGSPRVSWGSADVVLACDALGAADRASLLALDPRRSRVVAHDAWVPPQGSAPEQALPNLIDTLRGQARDLAQVRAAEVARVVLGDERGANTVLLGAALQLGWLPFSLASLESAIREHGVAIDLNLRALTLGRALAHDPLLADELLRDATAPSIGEPCAAVDGADPAALLGSDWQVFESALGGVESAGIRELLDQVGAFACDLIDYQGVGYARAYLGALGSIARADARVAPDDPEIARTAARELYRVMAYKDEYEVARLQLRGPWRRWLERHSPDGAELTYHLHPPLLRAFGLRRKLQLGRAVEPLLRGLVAWRRLRGTVLDPFAWLASRRAERELVAWYSGVLQLLAPELRAENRTAALEIARAPEHIRGYEDLKATRTEQVQQRVDALLAKWRESESAAR